MDKTEIRQGIHFDMDTKALEKYYPKPSWRKSYDDVCKFLEENGFEHEQGSGYHSILPMKRATAVRIIRKMIKKHSWLNKCMNVCTIADVPVTYDITHLFNKNADVPGRKPDTLTYTKPRR
jgi:virulence-associated protein VapD